jgi:hypothetical protein
MTAPPLEAVQKVKFDAVKLNRVFSNKEIPPLREDPDTTVMN